MHLTGCKSLRSRQENHLESWRDVVWLVHLFLLCCKDGHPHLQWNRLIYWPYTGMLPSLQKGDLQWSSCPLEVLMWTAHFCSPRCYFTASNMPPQDKTITQMAVKQKIVSRDKILFSFTSSIRIKMINGLQSQLVEVL